MLYSIVKGGKNALCCKRQNYRNNWYFIISFLFTFLFASTLYCSFHNYCSSMTITVAIVVALYLFAFFQDLLFKPLQISNFIFQLYFWIFIYLYKNHETLNSSIRITENRLKKFVIYYGASFLIFWSFNFDFYKRMENLQNVQ